jgi:mono/diheme cytochrome c family protein
MPRTLELFATTLLLGSFALACSDDSGDGEGAPPVSFATDIHPILNTNCGICHGAGTSEGPGYPAHGSDNVEEAYSEATADTGQGQKVYDRILYRINPPNPAEIMPLACGTGLDNGTCLTTAEYDLIAEWIDQGAPR